MEFYNIVRILITSPFTINLFIVAIVSLFLVDNSFAQSPQFKLSSGTLLVTPQAGGLEYNGTNFYITDSALNRTQVLSTSSVGASGTVLTLNNTGTPLWLNPAVPMAPALSGLNPATATNTIDNDNFSQVWGWSTLTTENALTISASALTTGSLLNITTPNAAVNSTNGLLYVANTSAGTSGVVIRIQSNSTTGSGLTVLANGNVGVGSTTPSARFDTRINYPSPITSTIPGFLLQNDGNAISGSGVTIDAGQGMGLTNIVAGAKIKNDGTGYIYLGDRGASRILLGDGTMSLYTGNAASGVTGGAVTWSNSGSTEAVHINSSGNVGIGTTTPTTKLDVNGGIRPGSTGITTGAACTTEGVFAYDQTAHTPVFCSNTLVWTSMSAGASSVPSKAIMFFNLAACPTGWILANGTSGTPDLRGEFIRGLDSGRGVDVSRTLASFQDATAINTNVYQGAFLYDWLNADRTAASPVISGAGTAGYTRGGTYVYVKPRNVALLPCMKQ